MGRNAGWLYAALFAGTLAAFWAHSSGVLDQTEYVEYSRVWIDQLDINFALKLDGLGILFGSLVLGIGALVLAYSAVYLPKKNNTSFYALITIFAISMLGLVLANDVIILFVFWEFTTLCSFFLISRSGHIGYQPSLRTLLLTASGGLCLLSASAAMVVKTGTSSISEILESPVWKTDTTFATTIAILIMTAAFTKSAQFPFHAWLPDAMAAIMPVSAYLHAAAMVKAGIFLLMRFSPVFASTPTWNIVLISVGLTTMVMGAIFALQRDDLKELLAYSTVSQLGLLVAAIGVGTKYALAAAGLHIISHALFKSSLFMSAGVIDKQTGTRKLSELGGLGRTMPLTGITVTLAALSMAGVAPLLGFASKEYILKAMSDTQGPSWVPIACTAGVVLGSILTFAYCGKIVMSLYTGNQARATKKYSTLLIAPGITALLGVALGLFPASLNSVVQTSTTAALDINFDPHLMLWHGLTRELLLTLIVFAVGSALVLQRQRVSAAIDRPLFPGNGVRALECVRSVLLSTGVRVRNITSVDSPPRHLAIPFILLMTLGVVVAVAQPQLDPVIKNSTRASDWFLLALITIPLGGLMIAKSRLAGVVLLGTIGLIITLFFFTLGAPDVGLTQLLIELLTVIFMMFSLRRLPKKFHHTNTRRKYFAGAMAIGVGALAAVTAYVYTGRRPLSDTSEYYLNNSKKETGGTNVVNTIIVDFRALDTLVELTVLATAGLAIMALLISARVLQGERRSHVKHAPTAADSFADNNIPVHVVTRALIPLVVIMSIYLMLRGHNEPGGGFIAGLVTCVGIALVYLGTTHRNFIHAKWLPYLFIGGGMALSILSALSGYVNNIFLRPLHLEFELVSYKIHLTTSMLFDTGVYLAVLGVILAAINRLSMDSPHDQLSRIIHPGEIEELSGPIEPAEVLP